MPGSELVPMATLLRTPPGAALRFVRVEADTAAPPVPLPTQLLNAVARRQATYRAGRLAAARALMAAGFRGPALIGQGDDGLPVWPAGWTGSISHTDRLAAAIVAAVPVVAGLDLEQVMTADAAAEIVAEIAPELAGTALDLPPAIAVTLAFSAKEALYKALFPETRQFREFTAARVDWPGGAGTMPLSARLTLTEDWGPAWPCGTVLGAEQVLANGHVLSLVWR